MKTAILRLASLLALLVAVSFPTSSSWAQDPIGLMLSTSGTVTAEDLSGASRRLVRRSPVFEGDTIITAARSRAQIRFNDNGLIALQPETSFLVQEHEFNGQEDGTESAVYSLLRGGLQAITGLIGRTNRESYRVDTPLATIGLRGTHWNAVMCTTACGDNPPGLYGGVADGGIDVCNGGGCTAVDADTYFYAPDSNTQPQLLLAPPSVVFADSSTTDEEGDGEGGGDDEGEGGADGGNQAPEDTSSFVAARAESVDPASELATQFGLDRQDTQPVFSESDRVTTRDPDDIIDELDGDGEAEPPNPRLVSNPTILLAASGSVGAFASTINEEGGPHSVNTVVIPGNGSDRIGLTVLADIGTTVTALDFFDPEGEDCQPCLFALAPQAGQSAVLQEFFTGSLGGSSYSLGRWLGDAVISESGDLVDALDNHHFAYASGISSSSPSFEIPTIAHYSLVNASLPTDASGVTGTLNTATMDIDFYLQSIKALDLAMTFGTRQVTSSLLEPVSLAHPSRLIVAARDIELTGLCTGGACGSQLALEGSSSLAFFGNNAQGVLGSFSLNDELNSSQSFAGAFVLERESTANHPRFYNGTPAGIAAPVGAVAAFASQVLNSSNDEDGPGGLSFAALAVPNPLIEGSSIVQTLNTTTIDGANKVLTGFHYEPGEYEDFDEQEPVWEVVDLSIDDAFLVEKGSTVLGTADQVAANWGLWLSPGGQSLRFSDEIEQIGPYLHYAYAESVTPVSYASEPVSQLAFYTLAGGTSPTDLAGKLGSLNSVNLTLDYFQQAITAFNLSATINSANYLASLYHPEYLDGSWSDLELDLLGSCSGGACSSGVSLEGESSLSFVGASAEGVLGHFSLSSESGSLGAYGVYLLEESSLTTPHPFIIGAPLTTMNSTIGVGSFASSDGYNNFVATIVPGAEVSDGSTTYTERLGLASLGGVGNIVADFTDGDTYVNCGEGCYISPYVFELQIQEGFLAEQGGISNFAGTGFGVNWGRWNALANASEAEYGESFPLSLADNHHFGYYGGPINMGPTRADFTNPSVVTYSWAGGTTPTNEYGETGVVNHFNVTLDFFRQSIHNFDLGLAIEDRNYHARMPHSFGDYNYYYSTNNVFTFEMLDEFGFLPLVGQCEGGDCGQFSETDSNGNPTGGTYLTGEFQFALLGNNSQGLLGSYALRGQEFDPETGCGYSLYCYEYSEGEDGYIGALGTAVLQAGAPQNHPRWITNFSDSSAQSSAGAAVVATKVIGTNEFHPLGEARTGLSFDVTPLSSLDGIVSSVNSVSGCTLCGVALSDAVLVEHGTNSHPYPFLDSPAELSWGTWESRSPNWLTTSSGAVTSGDFFQFAYADEMTASLYGLTPLTSFDTGVYYYFAGGTSPIDESGNIGFVDSMWMYFDFGNQTVNDFYADYAFLREDGYDAEYYLYQDSDSPVTLSPGSISAVIPLIGSCDNCGTASPYPYLDAEGTTYIAFAGDHAESVIGSLAGWTLDDGGGTYTEGYYSVQHAFVLHQEFNASHWVLNPPETIAPIGAAVAAATLFETPLSPGGELGISASGVVNGSSVTAGLTNVVDYDHSHPESVSSFSFDSGLCAGSGCDWELTKGYMQDYGNNLNDTARTFDAYWGRWEHRDDVNVNGVDLATNGYTQFAYSPDATENLPGSGTLEYNLLGSSPAFYENGDTGYISEIYMVIDFISQDIETFNLNVTPDNVNGVGFSMWQDGIASLDGDPSALISLEGTCVGGDCGSEGSSIGSSSITLVGSNAEGAIGAYDLMGLGTTHGASGSFVLGGSPYIAE